MTRIVVVGRTNLIGSKVITRLRAGGADAMLATPGTGRDAIPHGGLAETLAGADVLVDVSGPPWSDELDLAAFFTTSATTLLAAARVARVAHYVLLSVVGVDQLPESSYLRAKATQESLVAGSGVPYSIVRATQFLDYAKVVAELVTAGGHMRFPTVHLQPVGSDDVAAAVARRAIGEPLHGIVEAGWRVRARGRETIVA